MNKANHTASKDHPDLYRRSIKGGYWAFALRFLTQLLGFIKSIIVFNFLFNENLELVMVAQLLLAVLTTFSESGFHAALIRKPGEIDSYLDTAWVVGIFRGGLLFALVFLLAPLVVAFRVAPENTALAVTVIRVMGAQLLLHAFQNVGIVCFKKDLQFQRTFWLNMGGTLTEIVLTIALVFVFRSVWGYVIAYLVTAGVNLAMSYLLCSYRPRFRFDLAQAQELWKLGKWLFGGNIITYLLNEGDDWFVWFFLGGEPLKLYRYAYRFSNLPATHITSTISEVSFPAYAKIQHDQPRLREAYLKVAQTTALLSIPVALMVFVLGPDFVRLFLVEQSHSMIPILQVLAFYGLLRSLGATRGPLLLALGKPKTTWIFNLVRLVLLVVLIYPLTAQWGGAGTACAVLIPAAAIFPWGLSLCSRLLACPLQAIWAAHLSPVAAALVMAGIIAGVRALLINQMSLLVFFCLIVLGAATYLTSLWLWDRLTGRGAWRLVKENWMLLRQKAQRCQNKS